MGSSPDAVAPGPVALQPGAKSPGRAPVCAELGISRVLVYRLEAHGLLRANPALRRKIYSRAEVERRVVRALGSRMPSVKRRRITA